ncbi:hypothetical protein MBLNU457_4793t1 [Dothideomycetes sp. NU457]
MNTAPYQPYPDIRQYDPIRKTAGRPPGPGKPRKDYTAPEASFDSLEDFQNALRQSLDDARQDEYTERISQSMMFSSSAMLPIDHNNQLGQPSPPHDDQEQTNAFRSVYDLCDYEDQKERQKWQRGAARGLIAAVREVDGFKYSVNNIWSSKDDKGYRFSYTCLDSLENKDRHANSLRRSAAMHQVDTPPHMRARKETYDCGGQVSVKFSGARHTVEVIYKHTAVHTTVAERAPAPRANRRNTLDQSPDQSEYSSFDQSFNDAAANFANSLNTPGNHAQPGQYSTPTHDSAPGPSRESNASGFTVQRWKTLPTGHRGRGRPRKDGLNPIPRNTQKVAAPRPERPPSLAELLQLSAAEKRPEPEIPGKPYQMPPPLPAGPYGTGPPGYTAPTAGPYNYSPPPQTAPPNSHAPYMSSVPQQNPVYQPAFPPPPSQPQQPQKAPRANAPMAAQQHRSPARPQQQQQKQHQQQQQSQSQPRAPSPDPWFPRR